MIYFIVYRYNMETGAEEAVGSFSSRLEAEKWEDRNQERDWETRVLPLKDAK